MILRIAFAVVPCLLHRGRRPPNSSPVAAGRSSGAIPPRRAGLRPTRARRPAQYVAPGIACAQHSFMYTAAGPNAPHGNRPRTTTTRATPVAASKAANRPLTDAQDTKLDRILPEMSLPPGRELHRLGCGRVGPAAPALLPNVGAARDIGREGGGGNRVARDAVPGRWAPRPVQWWRLGAALRSARRQRCAAVGQRSCRVLLIRAMRQSAHAASRRAVAALFGDERRPLRGCAFIQDAVKSAQ